MKTLTPKQLHREAMRHWDNAIDHMKKAARLEAEAADNCDDPLNMGVLYRSAATMAFHAGNLDQSKDLARKGLAANPPEEIKRELMEALSMVEFFEGLKS